MSQDIFKQINNTIFDLQNADLQTYERPLKRLGQILQHHDLERFNEELTSNLDLEAFLIESKKSEGSMVGSAKLNWPADDREVLGLSLLLIKKLSTDPEFALNFSLTYFYSEKKIISNIHGMVAQLIIPFARDYKDYILQKGTLEMELKIPLSNKIFIVHGHDNGAKSEVARFLEKLVLRQLFCMSKPIKEKPSLKNRCLWECWFCSSFIDTR